MSRIEDLMRSNIYWPTMDRDTENCVKSCWGCSLGSKAPLVKYESWAETDSPPSMVYIDCAGPVNCAYYLIIIDNSTKWPEVCKCYKTTTKKTIMFLYELFSRYDVRETLVSDNGTQFTGYEFKNFYKIYTIKHIFFTPLYHPRSNRKIEKNSSIL